MAGLKLRKYRVVICVIARPWAFQLRAVDALAERRDRAAGVHALAVRQNGPHHDEKRTVAQILTRLSKRVQVLSI